MTKDSFITCDLVDANPEVQVCAPNMEGKRFYQYGGKHTFYGEIVTAKMYEDSTINRTILSENGKDSKGSGKILVVDGGASMRCGVMGDNIGLLGVENGWAGVVLYGCVRDVDDLAKMDIGIMALGSNPRKSSKRDAGQRDVNISFGGMTMTSGMYLYADNNGIVVADSALI